jgi:tRNA-Thr(GGU) m(6)t(6)A37 methyltransferase TsaA
VIHHENGEPSESIRLIPIGRISSTIVDRGHAPKQGREGAPDAWIELDPQWRDASGDLGVGEEILLLTWLHQGDRSIVRVHPRDDLSAPMRGVFSTRSQDRPNPIGIHRVRILEVESPLRFKVSDLEAFDGTPVIDIKPVLDRREER